MHVLFWIGLCVCMCRLKLQDIIQHLKIAMSYKFTIISLLNLKISCAKTRHVHIFSECEFLWSWWMDPVWLSNTFMTAFRLFLTGKCGRVTWINCSINFLFFVGLFWGRAVQKERGTGGWDYVRSNIEDQFWNGERHGVILGGKQ